MSNAISFIRSVCSSLRHLPLPKRAKKNPHVVLAWENLPLIQTAEVWLPRDVIQLIFMKLPPIELFTVSRVCRLWYQIASINFSLSRLFPGAPIVDRQVWEKHIDLDEYGLVFEEGSEPRITKREYVEIEHWASQVEKGQRVSILTLPKGLSMNKMLQIGIAPKEGNVFEFIYTSPEVNQLYGDDELKETTIAVVTNGVFQGSRELCLATQRKLVENLKCEMPQLLPFKAHIILRGIRSNPEDPAVPFGTKPLTFTRCADKVNYFEAVIGNLGVESGTVDFERYGVGGMKRFRLVKKNI
jgi:hypothetical protein